MFARVLTLSKVSRQTLLVYQNLLNGGLGADRVALGGGKKLQLQALQYRFSEQRNSILTVQKLADRQGVDAIETFMTSSRYCSSTRSR